MKRIALIALLALIPLLAFPQEEPGPPPPIRMVAHYLNLSPEQVDAWLGLLKELKIQQQPLHEQVRAMEEELKALLQEPEPDPAAVGTAVLEIHALRGQIQANEEDYRDAFEALLNEEQMERLYVLREASELAPLFPAFRETRLL